MEEQKLRQLFKNRSNCYADADDVIQAMDEDCFIKTVNEALHLHDVVGRSEQLVCPACKSRNIEIRHKQQSFRCRACNEGWAN